MRVVKRWHVGLVVLLLISFISPCSYAPNPLGIYYRIVGGYGFDPDSLFINRFAIAGDDPTGLLDQQLFMLRGKTGLDPLDSRYPLVDHEIQWVTIAPDRYTIAEAQVLLHYGNNTSRTYTIPMFEPPATAGLSNIPRETGLGRLFAPHLRLPNLPAPTTRTPVQIGFPDRLNLAPEAQQLAVFAWDGTWQIPPVRLSPNGQHLLLRKHAPDSGPAGALQLVPLDGGPARTISARVTSYDWSSDGRLVLALQPEADGGFTLLASDVQTNATRSLSPADADLLAITGNAAYVYRAGRLWRVPLDGQPAQQLNALPDLEATTEAPGALAVAPDGTRVAYRCGNEVCLADMVNEDVSRMSLGYQNLHQATEGIGVANVTRNTGRPVQIASLHLAWSGDSQRLAVVVGAERQGHSRDRAPELWIIDRSGATLHNQVIGPDGPTGAPHWTADGRFILLNAFPVGGRRIVAVESDSGAVWDLSRPRWDAFASLSPDSTQLLLWNGRGGFWSAPLTIDN